MIRIDMHLHTDASFDCINDGDRVVETARARGLDGICVTDHNEIVRALELQQRHPEFVIVGEEVKTAERVDIIGLFITELIPKGTPARETCERIRAQGGVVYVPHPFAGGKGGNGRILPEIERLVDAVEGFNARLHDQRLNESACEWARARGLPLGAGSDAHTLREVGRGFVELPRFAPNRDAFLAALRQGTIGGTESSRLVHLGSVYARVHKRFSA